MNQLEFRPHASAMLVRFGFFLRAIARFFFSRIAVSEESIERAQNAAREGQILYVSRTCSSIDYLFFNHLLLKFALPLSVFANGINLSWFHGWAFAWRQCWGRLTGRLKPQLLADEFEEKLKNQEDAAFLFMKPDAEHSVGASVFERLIELQKRSEKPILLLPQTIIWRRDPAVSQIYGAFGELDTRGTLRKLWSFWRHYKEATVKIGEPIHLQRFLAEHEGLDEHVVARKLMRILLVHFSHEALSIRGPALKPAALLDREIIESPQFQADMRKAGCEEQLDEERALARSKRYLKEIGSAWSFDMVRFVAWLLDRLFRHVFQGVEFDEEGLGRVIEAAKQIRSAPLVLVPSHKSHTDYLVLSWAMLRNGFIPPHVAAGANLSFFPVGWLLRRGGAFFLRRSFVGIPLYKVVFKHYLWKLVKEGYPVEFFIEGGRSRTGKLLPPKLGMLSMLLEGIRRGEFADLQFVPINLSYERVIETGAYRRELLGGKKQAESVGGVVKASKVLRSRYGRIYIHFEAPVRLSDWLRDQGNCDLREASDAEFRFKTTALGNTLMDRIAAAAVVTPSALVGTVLLSHSMRGLTGAQLRKRAGFWIALLQRRHMRLSRSLEHILSQQSNYVQESLQKSPEEGEVALGETLRPLLDEALLLLRRLIQTSAQGDLVIYSVSDKSRLEMDYYRNQLLGCLAGEALLATSIAALGQKSKRAKWMPDAVQLLRLMKNEFVYFEAQPYEKRVQALVEIWIEEGRGQLLGDGEILWKDSTFFERLRASVLHLLEGYSVALAAFSMLKERPLEKEAFLAQAHEQAEKMLKDGQIRCAEATSTAILKNALDAFASEGLVTLSSEMQGRKRVTRCALGSDFLNQKKAWKAALMRWRNVAEEEEEDEAPKMLKILQTGEVALPTGLFATVTSDTHLQVVEESRGEVKADQGQGGSPGGGAS